MNVIDYRTFKQLLHIEDDDCWLAAPGFQGQFNYRIAEGAVRAVPWGIKVDESSRVPIRPLIRDMNYCPTQLELLDGELRDLEPWNPSGVPDAVLFELPAPVTVVIGFLNQADLWWMVDKVLWQGYGLPEIDADSSIEYPGYIGVLGQEPYVPAQPEATRGGGLIGKPQALGCFNQAGLRTALAPFMREPKKLEGLFSNARRNGLYLCKTQQRWDLKKVVFWLLKNGYLKPDITERRVGDWLEHTLRV